MLNDRNRDEELALPGQLLTVELINW
jgi:hypothetical protein